jgi:hypothetical protein
MSEREHQERRPKNAGVHKDQNLRHHSKTQRHAAKQQLNQEKDCICEPDERYGYDPRCRVHGHAAK